jgi:hypothetical protein
MADRYFRRRRMVGPDTAQDGTLAGDPNEPVRTTDDPTALLGHDHPRHHHKFRSTI